MWNQQKGSATEQGDYDKLKNDQGEFASFLEEYMNEQQEEEEVVEGDGKACGRKRAFCWWVCVSPLWR